MVETRLYLLDVGSVILDQNGLTPGRGMGTLVTVPATAFLITHPKGNILFDTGINPSVITDSKGKGEVMSKALGLHMTEEQKITNQLAQLGYKPDDIKYVVNSHLHHDHAGGNQFFPKAEFIVQKIEIRVAFYPEVYQKRVYSRKDFDHPLNYKDIEGDYDIFGDGQIVIWSTPGHSQGHQSLVVNLKNSGKFILAGDAVNEPANIDLLIVPGNVWSPDESIRSLKRLRDARSKGGAFLIYGHDPKQWAQLKHAPDFYD